MAVRLRPEWAERRRKMAFVSETKVESHAHGHLVGPAWNARQLTEVAHAAGFIDIDDLTMATCVSLAECNGYINSYCDNFDDAGTLVKKDVGAWQIDIDADLIGTAYEKRLYEPRTNANAAHALFLRRGWQPWASYTSGICFDDTYVYRALLAVMNFAAEGMAAGQARVTARAAHHSLAVPLVSTHQLHDLYPHVPQL